MGEVELEIWKAIQGWDGLYEVSSLGAVRSRCRNRWHSSDQFRVLHPRQDGQGYLKVFLHDKNRKRDRKVHQLVAEAFIGVRPTAADVNHKNGIKSDNRAANLEYVTRAENTKHAYDTGLTLGPRGTANGRSVLTEGDVVSIRAMRRNGLTLSWIAEYFGVSVSAVSHVTNGHTWKSLP